MSNPEVNINLNVNLNININVKDESSWARISEENLLTDLFQEIEKDNIVKKRKTQKTMDYLIPILDNIDVNFEPDPTYRDNVRYIIIGLVICQILKQKTINLFHRGKEDREYLASYLMMKIQSYLINNHEVDEWDDILKCICKYYEGKIRINKDMLKLIEDGINTTKIITQEILVSTVLSNKKNYKLKKIHRSYRV